MAQRSRQGARSRILAHRRCQKRRVLERAARPMRESRGRHSSCIADPPDWREVDPKAQGRVRALALTARRAEARPGRHRCPSPSPKSRAPSTNRHGTPCVTDAVCQRRYHAGLASRLHASSTPSNSTMLQLTAHGALPYASGLRSPMRVFKEYWTFCRCRFSDAAARFSSPGSTAGCGGGGGASAAPSSSASGIDVWPSAINPTFHGRPCGERRDGSAHALWP